MLSACNPNSKSASKSSAEKTAAQKDTPILAVKKGDKWRYEVKLDIPADVSSPGAAGVDTSYERIRIYLGKISPAKGLPEVDCFEVSAPNSPTEREFVDISEDRILMRGSMIMRPETTKPMWLERAIPFVIAGMKPGTELPEFQTLGGELKRKTEVVARETIVVPAGSYPCIRMLTIGMDGQFELRRTIWFSPGNGIIREEKTRYLRDKLIYHENQQLVETSLKKRL